MLFVNACDAAQLDVDDATGYAEGLVQTMLSQVASSYIGPIGHVGDGTAQFISLYILNAAQENEGAHIPEVLRRMREQAASDIGDAKLSALSDEDQLKKRKRFFYTFLYVFYGHQSACLHLRPNQIAQGGTVG